MIRILVLICLLTVSTCVAQEPQASPPEAASTAQEAGPNAADAQSIVIPAGTRIPLSLSSPIAAKSARPGFPVRAVSGFPVTVGLRVVIPSGSYFEGVIDKVKRGGPSGREVQMHFTKIIYPNGYSLGVDGENSVAKNEHGNGFFTAAAVRAGERETGYVLVAAQQAPTPPQFPGPRVGVIVGVVAGVMTAAMVVVLVVAHHNAGTTGILLDTGWQFDIVLNSPVIINLVNIPAAAATPRVQM